MAIEGGLFCSRHDFKFGEISSVFPSCLFAFFSSFGISSFFQFLSRFQKHVGLELDTEVGCI